MKHDYGYCSPGDTDALRERLSVCADEVSAWMKSNRLQLNPAETEVLWCASMRRRHQIPSVPFHIGDTAVIPVSVVRDIGVYIDCCVTMSAP